MGSTSGVVGAALCRGEDACRPVSQAPRAMLARKARRLKARGSVSLVIVGSPPSRVVDARASPTRRLASRPGPQSCNADLRAGGHLTLSPRVASGTHVVATVFPRLHRSDTRLAAGGDAPRVPA